MTVFRTLRLLHLWAAAAFLDSTPERVMRLIEEGIIPWAFNIGVARTHAREVRVLAKCVADVLNGNAPGETSDDWAPVADEIIPATRESLTTAELAQAWSCDVRHLYQLIQRKELAVLNAGKIRKGPGGSAVIARKAALDFLKQRRVF